MTIISYQHLSKEDAQIVRNTFPGPGIEAKEYEQFVSLFSFSFLSIMPKLVGLFFLCRGWCMKSVQFIENILGDWINV